MVGKWHLGHADREYWPQNRGFDHFYGNLIGEVDYFTKDGAASSTGKRNGAFLKEDGYFTKLIGNEAVKLIEHRSRRSRSSCISPAWRPMRPIRHPRNNRPIRFDRRSSRGGSMRHDHGVRRTNRPRCRRTRQEGTARQYDHPLLQRQWRCDERTFRHGRLPSSEEDARSSMAASL